MRFDDSLDTVLAAENSTVSGLEATWRQVVDLIGRGRAAPRAGAIERLRAIRGDVSVTIRAASARGLERARPPVELVALFIDDEASVAAPVVRSASLAADEWIALLPAMRPATRGVLRHRRDLDDAVARALAAFGPVDFALSDPAREPTVAAPAPVAEPSPFVAVAQAVRDLPILAETSSAAPAAALADAPVTPPAEDPFEIARIVARIEAHQRAVEDRPALPEPEHLATVERFRFETDRSGLIRWVDGVERGAVVGLSLTAGRDGAPIRTDGIVAGALARRSRFADAQLVIDGGSSVAGTWRISGVPVFDPDSGRFTGHRGTARRPRPDEQPRLTAAASSAPDALRQLVHELRTPTNAISGFAEMIERELLGVVPAHYRAQATTIRTQTDRLLGAIDDLDTAARIETGSLSLHAESVALTPLLSRVLTELTPLADLRGARLTLEVAGDVQASGDARALERLFSRLLTALVASTARGEAIAGRVDRDAQAVTFEIARPTAFAAAADTALFSADAEVEAVADGEPLLGGGFAFRLARRLVTELGGTLVIGAERLTLRLPAAVDRAVEQATV